MNKKLIAGLASTLVLGLATSAFAFSDVADSHWAAKYVNKLAELKVVNGVNATTFNPNGKVTRAEFAKMIVEAKGLAKENPATATFTDVAADAWYYGYVEAAAKAGYVNGVGEGKFNPNALVTRQEIAKIIVEAAGLDADATKAVNFDDAASISTWAKGYVAVAADKKFVEGYQNKFNPLANATRAEAAKLTYTEMVYEGKIIAEEVVEADLLTEINSNSVEIGGKTYDLIGTNGSGTEYMVNGQLVTKDAFVEDTRVKFTLNASGKVSKLEAGSDYKFVKGEVTEVGNDGDVYVTIDGKKIYVDNTDDDYYSAVINEDDEFPTADQKNPGVVPTLNKDYLVIYNSDNNATYALKLATTSSEGVLESKGKDKDGLYVYIDGKKYYFNEEDNAYDVEDLDGNKYANFEDNYFANLDTDVRVEFETNSDNEITQIEDSALDMEGISKVPQVKATADGYDVWVPVMVKGSDNFNVTEYLHTEITDEDEVSAIEDLIDDEAIDPVTAAPTGDITELDTDAKVYVNAARAELYDIAKSNYVVVDLNEDGDATKVTAVKNIAFGLVESLEKSSDKVTSVTINGTKYTYDGKSTKYSSSTKGNVSVIGDTYVTGGEKIEVGYLAVAVLDSAKNIISFSVLQDADDFDATVSATEGQLSHFSEDEDGSKKIYVPADTVEVRLSNGSYAWVTYDDDATDSTLTTMSIKGTKDFAKFEVGQKVYVILANNTAIDTSADSTDVFDQTVVDSNKAVRYDSDTNTLSVAGADVYTSLTAYTIYQK